MLNKKLILLMGVLVLLVGAAVFVGGRLLTQRIDVVRLGSLFEGDFRSMIVPASELPTTTPEVTGAFIERQDNLVTIETKSLEA